MEIGAQLYTLRTRCKTLEDFSETLAKVADIGYKNVQVSGVCPYEPQWLADQLKKNGLKCVLTHIAAPRIAQEPEIVAAEHDIFGCEYVGLGAYRYIPEEGQTPEAFAEIYGKAARQLKACGKHFMYHNHAFEFQKIGNKLLFDLLLEAIPPEYMGVTLDTYWVQVGGADPAQWLEKLAGRIPCIHLKDYAFGPKMAVVGEGNLNFDRIFEKAEAGGTKYMLVEQDDCNGEDPFDCMKRSYQYLKAHGFE